MSDLGVIPKKLHRACNGRDRVTRNTWAYFCDLLAMDAARVRPKGNFTLEEARSVCTPADTTGNNRANDSTVWRRLKQLKACRLIKVINPCCRDPLFIFDKTMRYGEGSDRWRYGNVAMLHAARHAKGAPAPKQAQCDLRVAQVVDKLMRAALRRDTLTTADVGEAFQLCNDDDRLLLSAVYEMHAVGFALDHKDRIWRWHAPLPSANDVA